MNDTNAGMNVQALTAGQTFVLVRNKKKSDFHLDFKDPDTADTRVGAMECQL